MCGTVYGDMHLNDLLGSITRVGYCIRFLSSAIRPLIPIKHYNGLIINHSQHACIPMYRLAMVELGRLVETWFWRQCISSWFIAAVVTRGHALILLFLVILFKVLHNESLWRMKSDVCILHIIRQSDKGIGASLYPEGGGLKLIIGHLGL